MGVPSVTKSSSVVTAHSYDASVTETATQIFTGRGNLYGFLAEENGGADVFIQIFDAAAAGDVTVGTTAPDFTFRLTANSTFGKDVNDSPLHFFAKGCVVAVTTTRTGSGAPAAGATIQTWFWNR
jgi:hypothetical protein